MDGRAPVHVHDYVPRSTSSAGCELSRSYQLHAHFGAEHTSTQIDGALESICDLDAADGSALVCRAVIAFVRAIFAYRSAALDVAGAGCPCASVTARFARQK